MVRVGERGGRLVKRQISGISCVGEVAGRPRRWRADVRGAALEYRGVYFRAHDLGHIGFKQADVFPLELDGAAGHELVSIGYDGLEVYRFDGDEFALSSKTSLPAGSLGLADHAVAAEFDGAPGRDLAVVDSGDWVGLYHIEDGAPVLVGETTFGPPTSQGLDWPVAVGPDENGKWRVVAHFDSANVFFLADPLALWEVQGTSFVQIERFDLETAACVIDDRCFGADLDGDGRTDAICALRDECSESQAGQKEIVHVVLLAQADGNVTIAEYPTNGLGPIGAAIDLDGDDSPDLLVSELRG
jgi:hypothetical protein